MMGMVEGGRPRKKISHGQQGPLHRSSSYFGALNQRVLNSMAKIRPKADGLAGSVNSQRL